VSRRAINSFDRESQVRHSILFVDAKHDGITNTISVDQLPKIELRGPSPIRSSIFLYPLY
jgi:hypothetical protein